MRFSVIVPVYNSEKYLPDCVRTVFSQDHTDHELILVDDGSGEECARRCDEFAGKNDLIRVVHQRNSGPLLARLNGVAAARGDYCVFLDADDMLVSDCLSILSDAIDRYDAPDMLIYSYYREEPDGKRRKVPLTDDAERKFGSDDKKELYSLFFSGTGLNSIWTKCIKRTVFDREHPDYGRFAALRCAEDRVLSMVALSASDSVVRLPEPLYIYRIFPGSTTRHFSFDAIDRFNTNSVYPFEIECLRSWDMYTPDSVSRLNASYISQMLYVHDMFFFRSGGDDRRRVLAEYPWRSLVPEECLKDFTDNPFLNDKQKEIATLVFAGDIVGVIRFYRRKKLMKSLRGIKRSIFSIYK